MKLGKKLLAGICTISVLLAMVVIPASAFIGSTATMPADFTVIEDFDDESTLGWQAHTTATLEFSDAYGYGTTGKSAHVTWDSKGWSGFKTANYQSIQVSSTGLAFWAYNAGSELKDFYVNLTADGVTYEAKITLKVGEAIYQIPWTDFVKNGVSYDTSKAIAQIIFTKSGNSADYYIDQIGCYTGDATQSEFIPSTVAMPDNYKVIDSFNSASTLGWNANKTTMALSADRGYGRTGKSMYVSAATGTWCGFKTSSNQSITLTGEGIAFWAYNAGSENNRLYVKLTSAGVAYEKQITLAAGEKVYQIPWSDFKKNDVAIDPTQTVTLIEFTSGIASADYYIDELSCYSNYIASTLEMPEDFTLIDDFNGENTLGWAATNKATLKIAAERGYGEEGKGAHVTWSESGWSGFKTANYQSISVNGDGLAFWAYNAGSELKDFAVTLTADGVVYEAKITLKVGEAVYKIPFTDFVKDGVSFDPAKTVAQIVFTKSAGSADYFVDQIGFYADFKKPEVSTVVFDTSTKCSSSAVTGTGATQNGNKGGLDTVKWKLYDIKDDPRFTRACWFIAEDVAGGTFNILNVSKIGTLDAVDLSDAYYFGNLVFWIKSDTANRSLKCSLVNKDTGKGADRVEFTVTEAGVWQQVVIPVSKFFADESILENDPDFLEKVTSVSFTGQEVEGTFQFGEEFKIAGLRIYDSDVTDYSEYDGLDTEPSQPEDDGSYNPDSEIIGSLDFISNTYSGNPGYGTVEKTTFDDFATEQNGIKITFGEGIRDEAMATKGLSIWFGKDGTQETIDVSTLEDGYFSMWVRGSRAGMSFYYLLLDDTDSDAKTSLVKTYTIKEANTWEEVRIRISDYCPPGALDTEYVFKLSLRTGYGAFNWRYAYTDERWLNTGDVLELAAANVTEGKPIDPFAEVADDGIDEGTEGDGNTGTGTGTGTGSSTGTDTNNNTAGDILPVTGESAAALVMLLTFACISGVIAAFAKAELKRNS